MSEIASALPLCVGVFFGGFVSGISGFAFSAVAGAIVLHFYPANIAVPLMMVCALIAQTYSLVNLRKSMEWAQSLPLIIGGVVGIPLGLYALRSIDSHSFRIGFGIFLTAYAAYMLLWPATVISKEVGGKATDSAIGFASGVVGGLTAFPGALPTMWCDLRGLPKDAKRGLTQPFIATMQLFGFLLVMIHGDFSADMGWKLVWALPGLIVGTVLGLAAFGKINDLIFRRTILSLLMLSGVSLI
jgi:uncharacterized membrane protein YfcA